MTLRFLERLAVAVFVLFMIAMCLLALDHARRSEDMARNLLDGHVEAAALLGETDQSLSQGRQLYGYLITAQPASLNAPITVLDSLAELIRPLEGPGQTELADLKTNLSRLRAVLYAIDEMRARGEFSDTMVSMAEEAAGRLAAVAAQAADLAGRGLVPDHSREFVVNASRSLKTLTTRYLRAKPDRLPVFNELMDKISRDLDRLSSMAGMESESEPIRALAADVGAIRFNVPRILASISYDPNFMANTNKEEKNGLNRLWDSALGSVQSLKERQSAKMRGESDHFLDAVHKRSLTFIFLTAGALTLAAAGLFAIKRAVHARVDQIKRGAALIAGGRLSHRIHPVSNDVLGELAGDFNTMAESLQREKNAAARTMEELARSRDMLDRLCSKRRIELNEAEDNLHLKDTILSHSREGVMICDEDLRIVDANPAMSRLTGTPSSGLLGLSPDAFCHNSEAVPFREALRAALETEGRYEGEIEILSLDGRTIPLRVLFARVSGGPGCSPRHVGVCLDVSEQKETERRLAEQAMSDGLTGLPNREALMVELEERVGKARSSGRELAVVLLDLDGFKSINDSYGHAAGDSLLRIVSMRLEACMRKDGMIARLGEDEFALVSGMLERPAQALTIAQRAANCFFGPFEVAGETHRLSASIGLALYPGDSKSALELIRNAGLALHRAKAHGKGRLEIFTPELDVQARSRLALERDIREALDGGHFEVHYQPIVNAASGQIHGAEALLRWNRNGETVSPALFIPVCEEMFIMGEVTDLLLDRVTRDIACWEARGLTPHVSVNISARLFSDPGFPSRLRAILDKRRVPPERIGLEITETAIMHNPQTAEETLRALRRSGHSISVDDFGTGYCSLRYLQKYPFTTLKIDRQFIADLAHKESRAIVSATIAMAKSLELKVVAEGVETTGQMELLRAKGCDYFQGFLFSPALPPEEFARLSEAGLSAGNDPVPPKKSPSSSTLQ